MCELSWRSTNQRARDYLINSSSPKIHEYETITLLTAALKLHGRAFMQHSYRVYRAYPVSTPASVYLTQYFAEHAAASRRWTVTVDNGFRETDTAGRQIVTEGKEGMSERGGGREKGRKGRRSVKRRETQKDRSDVRVRPDLSSLSVDDALYFPLILLRLSA